VVLNTFSYHLTPGGFLFSTTQRRAPLGCAVIPARSRQHRRAIRTDRGLSAGSPIAAPRTFSKILLDAGRCRGTRSFLAEARALGVGRGRFRNRCREEIKSRGIDAYQALWHRRPRALSPMRAPDREGLIVNEDIILEIVKTRHRPKLGARRRRRRESWVTSLDPDHPWIRPRARRPHRCVAGPQSLRTQQRAEFKGWMGRADQTTKIKGHVSCGRNKSPRIGRQHPEAWQAFVWFVRPRW